MSGTISAKEIWKTVKGVLEVNTTINRANYETWIKDTEGVSFDGRLFIIGTPKTFAKEWLERHLSPIIRKTLIEVMRTLDNHASKLEDVQIQFDVINRNPANVGKTQRDDLFTSVGQIFNPEYRFDTFIAGKENERALTAAKAVAENPGRRWNPLVFVSPSGLGKTHLLHAIGCYVHSNKCLPVILKTADQFTNEFVAAACNGGIIHTAPSDPDTDEKAGLMFNTTPLFPSSCPKP